MKISVSKIIKQSNTNVKQTNLKYSTECGFLDFQSVEEFPKRLNIEKKLKNNIKKFNLLKDTTIIVIFRNFSVKKLY